MRAWAAVLIAGSLTGCMCRPGVVDCTTGRAYPGFCKPLCGGPCDPFVWLAGDCSCDCRCHYKCAYTPYGGRTICGDDMAFTPSCTSPPPRWSPPAVPTPPSGHVVNLPPNPPPLSPAPKRPKQADEGGGPTAAPPAPQPEAETPASPPEPPGDGASLRERSGAVQDARNDRGVPDRL